MATRTRAGKVRGRPDTYVFVTLDFAKGHVVHMSGEYSEAELRKELKHQGLSDAEIDAEVSNAQANEI